MQPEEVVEAIVALIGDEQWPTKGLVALKAVADMDIIYYHEAIRQPDRKQFCEAAKSELTPLALANTYSIRKCSETPSGKRFLPMVWQMRRKQTQATGEVRKYKSPAKRRFVTYAPRHHL